MESTRELIEKRAYELFLARGGESGNALQDWLQAEKIIYTEINSKEQIIQAKLKEKSSFTKVGKKVEVVKAIKDMPKNTPLRNGFIEINTKYVHQSESNRTGARCEIIK